MKTGLEASGLLGKGNSAMVALPKSFCLEEDGLTASEKYLEFAELMRRFMKESGARSTLDLDAFFYDYWHRRINRE